MVTIPGIGERKPEAGVGDDHRRVFFERERPSFVLYLLERSGPPLPEATKSRKSSAGRAPWLACLKYASIDAATTSVVVFRVRSRRYFTFRASSASIRTLRRFVIHNV